MVGNSLKYTNTGSKTIETNSLWKSYQNKKTSQLTNTPAHLLLSPSNTSKLINFTNLNDAGISTLKDSSAFKKIQYFSKTNPQALTSTTTDFSLKYNKLANLYLSDNVTTSTNSYGTFRQHNYTSTLATTNNTNTLLDPKSINMFSEYTLAIQKPSNEVTKSGLSSRNSELNNDANTLRVIRSIEDTQNISSLSSAKVVSHPNLANTLNSESDSKRLINPFRYLLNDK